MASAGRSGKDAILVEAYLRNRKGLVALATQVTGDVALAEDLVQDVFLRLLERRRGGDFRYLLAYPFLHTAVMNAARNHVRDERSQARLQRDRREEIVELAANMATPYWMLRLNELRAAIQRAAATLPIRQREVFRLALDGLCPGDIAKELGITPANAREQRRRARNAVALVLEDQRVM